LGTSLDFQGFVVWEQHLLPLPILSEIVFTSL